MTRDIQVSNQPSGWGIHTLGQLAINFDAKRVPIRESNRKRGPFPYYGASGVVDYVDGYIFDGEYVLVAEDGENLKSRKLPVAFIARGKFWVNNHAHVLQGGPGIDTRFLCYALQVADITSFLSGSTMPKLTQCNLSRILLPTPGLKEQRSIVEILGALDNQLELLSKTNETLEAMARAIFKSWFVDFDPVRAKAEGREPGGMDIATAALFPNELQDSELGPIPKGWQVDSILEIANLLSGGTPKTNREEYWNGLIKWASAKDVSQCSDTFLLQTERTITNRGLIESSTKLIPAYCTVVVARGATTGRMAMFGEGMAMNQTCYALSSRTYTPFTLYCLFRNTISQLVHSAHGSVFETITTTTFTQTRVLIPPSELLARCESILEPLFNKVLVNSSQGITLSALRDTLLRRLILGKLRVPEAEVMLAEVI